MEDGKGCLMKVYVGKLMRPKLKDENKDKGSNPHRE